MAGTLVLCQINDQKTRVVAQGLDDALLKKAALGMLERVFNEDSANLKNYK
jgi:hypothetical protein